MQLVPVIMLLSPARLTDPLRAHSVPSTMDCNIHVSFWTILDLSWHTISAGSYPIALNRYVSPLGNHSLTVFAEDDEGFKTETTVHYFLEDDTTKPTGE